MQKAAKWIVEFEKWEIGGTKWEYGKWIVKWKVEDMYNVECRKCRNVWKYTNAN